MSMYLPVETHAGASKLKICVACGKPIAKNRIRYCTENCKSQFAFKLRWFNNLLRALRARYATFSFTETVLILNVLSSQSEVVHTYFYPRTPGKKPAQDIDGMVFELGSIWWENLEESKNERHAAEHLLQQGRKQVVSSYLVKPQKTYEASRISRQLLHLRIKKRDLLDSSDPESAAKSAYKNAALKHHPDQGGDAHKFRQIHRAYQDLKAWLSNPSFSSRRGVPGHWSFIAGKSRWYSPL